MLKSDPALDDPALDDPALDQGRYPLQEVVEHLLETQDLVRS